MRRKAILILLLVLSTISIVSCITLREVHVDLSCAQFAQNPKNMRNDFEIEVGDKLYISLCSNPSTGFQWSYTVSGDKVLKEEGHGFEAAEDDALGASGKETWTFRATEKGTTTIDMKYGQSSEGGIKDQWAYRVNVVVKSSQE
jgi:predicted secreted protein